MGWLIFCWTSSLAGRWVGFTFGGPGEGGGGGAGSGIMTWLLGTDLC